jgi:hypothetical protein
MRNQSLNQEMGLQIKEKIRRLEESMQRRTARFMRLHFEATNEERKRRYLTIAQQATASGLAAIAELKEQLSKLPAK